MNKKVIIKIFLTSIILTLMFSIQIFAVVDPTTTRIKIDNDTAWTNINISESYAECEALNSPTSTLGTENLKAHLTTDYDWSAMAVFSVSQYGATTTNAPKTTSTTKNKSGIYDIGTNKVQTTTLKNGTTSTSSGWVKGLYEDDGTTLKKYVNKIDPSTGVDQNGRIAITYVLEGGTRSWLGTDIYTTWNNYPVGIRDGLFRVSLGGANVFGEGGTGSRT